MGEILKSLPKTIYLSIALSLLLFLGLFFNNDGFDFDRMFKRKIETATIGMATTNIPIISSEFDYTETTAAQILGLIFIDTENLALQDLLNKNKEYDVLIAPKFSKTIEGFWPIYWTETVMVKAHIGKIK